jgi:hypothetical protein
MAGTEIFVTGGRDWPAFVWLCVATLVLISLYAWFFHIAPYKKPPRPEFPFTQVKDDRALILQHRAGRERVITSRQAMVFAFAVVLPTELRQRVVEEYTPDRRTLKQSSSVEIQVPEGLWKIKPIEDERQSVYMPVLIPSKGELHDDLHIRGADGEALNSLSYREYLTLVAAILHILLVGSYQLAPGQQLPVNAQKAELLALQAIMRRKDPALEVPDLTAADSILNLSARDRSLRDLASEFVRKLITHYAIVATIPMPLGRRFRFSYSQTLVPAIKFTAERSKRRWSFGGALRVGLGARPVELTIDVSNASSCQSYHLHIHAPDDIYLASQTPVGLESLIHRPSKTAPTAPHCRFRRRLGQPHAHFYARYMPPLADKERPQIRFKYFEVPPGSTLRAAATALACAAIVWLVGFINSRYSDPGTDAPAFLLAFPALAATWLGFDAPSRRLLEGTLSARLCLIITAALSVGASGLYMAHKAGAGHKWPAIPDGLAIWGITDLGWGIAAALAIANAAQICYKCTIRTWQYVHLLVKPVTQS